MSVPKPLSVRILPEVTNALKSINEAQKITENEQTEAFIKLLFKIEKVLEKENNGICVNFSNEFSEAILYAWDDVYYTLFDKFKSKVDQLNFGMVDTTEERKFIREINEKHDKCGFEGTLYFDEKYEESLKELKKLVKNIDVKDKELEDGFIGKIQKNVFILIGASIAPWLWIVSKFYFKISNIELIGLLIAIPVFLWLLALFFVFLFAILSRKN